MVIPGRNVGSGFDASTHTSMVVASGIERRADESYAALHRSSMPATLSSAGCRL